MFLTLGMSRFLDVRYDRNIPLIIGSAHFIQSAEVPQIKQSSIFRRKQSCSCLGRENKILVRRIIVHFGPHILVEGK